MDDVPQSRLDEIISNLSKEKPAKIAKALRTWKSFARPEQLPPPQPWQVWMFLAGRGAGKTRSGSEWIRENVRQGVKRIGLIAPTAGDSRDVMVEGSSGILEVCWEYDRDIKGNPLGKPLYEPSKRRLTWANGAMATTFSAEEPERLRGPQNELLWCDELEQLPPPQPWQVWMFLAGRGAGKTRSGSEWIRENVRQGVKRIGLIAPTAGDSRDVMVEDSSGILEVCWEYDRDIKGNPLYEPAPSFQGRRAVSVSERVWWPHQCPHRRTDRAERGFGLEALGSAFRCTRCAPSGGRFFRDDYARAEPRFIRPQSLTAKLEVE